MRIKEVILKARPKRSKGSADYISKDIDRCEEEGDLVTHPTIVLACLNAEREGPRTE